MPGSKHGPNKLSNYREIHSTWMHRLASEGFVLSDGVTLTPFGDGLFLMSGDIECAGDIVVEVTKLLQVVDGHGTAVRVRTASYSYNAHLRGRGNILRYDSPHSDQHRPKHHVHRYDVLAGDRDGTVTDIGDDDWPTLGEVLEELREWYFANAERINRDR